MTQRTIFCAVFALMLSAIPSLGASPPARPLPVTASQFQALRQIENLPENAAVRQVHATYQSEHEQKWEATRTADDVTSAATFLGWTAALVVVIMAAAI